MGSKCAGGYGFLGLSIISVAKLFLWTSVKSIHFTHQIDFPKDFENASLELKPQAASCFFGYVLALNMFWSRIPPYIKIISTAIKINLIQSVGEKYPSIQASQKR